jgi:WD40 repeat protein
MLELHIERTDHPSSTIIKKFSAATILVGRASESDLSLDDPSVSRRHCRLSRGVDGWTIEDLESANGTLLDGERIADIRLLAPDAAITVGAFRLTLRLIAPSRAKPPRSAPAWVRRARGLATTALAVALACVGGWTSARIWDDPLRLPIHTIDCPHDDPALLDLDAALARTPTATAEDATLTALSVLAESPALPTACGLHVRAESALAAALARMDHRRLGQHTAPVRSLVADDTHVAAIDRDGHLMLWSYQRRGQPLLAPPRDAQTPAPDLLSLARSPDGRALIAGTSDGRVLAWDLPTADLTADLTHSARPITAVQRTATHLWSVDDAGTLHLWTLGATTTRTATTTTWPGVHTLTPLRDGRMLVFGAGRAAVLSADLRRQTPLTTGAALRTVAVADADIIAGDLAGKVTRWRLGRTLRPEPLTAHGGPIRTVAIQRGLVASIGDDDALRLVELDRRVRRGGPPLVLLAEVPVPVDRLVITGDTLIGSGPEGALVTWDLSQRTRRLPATLHDAHLGPISALAATPTAAISGGDDGKLRAWPTTPPPDDDTPLLTRACAALGWDAPGCDPTSN